MMDRPVDIIACKRDGRALTRAQIEQFVRGVVDGSFRDYQASALLMAIVLNGMSHEETVWLTEAMLRSGRLEHFPDCVRPKVDKHSTGGVGDKISLVLAPLAATVGLTVPMMSGRGLGHTGGTLDKLEAIPGFSVTLMPEVYRMQLEQVHAALIGQSADMVPADRILYGLRDVTATVESIPLICASILSKKLAEGIDALVLDVKCGVGAFMQSELDARRLAEALVCIGRDLGKPTTAILTRMDQPLGYAVGNALEVAEVLDCLRGRGPEDVMRVSFELTAEMMRLGGLVESRDDALPQLEQAIQSGAALGVFSEVIGAQGGDVRIVEDPRRLPQTGERELLYYTGTESAYVVELDARKVGEAACLLGAGRQYLDDVIDPAVGVRLRCKLGALVQPGDVLAELHYNDSLRLEPALEQLRASYRFGRTPPSVDDIIIDRILS